MENQLIHINGEGMEITVLNALENAILRYGRENSDFVKNPYQFFSEKLGYKAKNYLYWVFQHRNGAKLGYDDVKKILERTNDEDLRKMLHHDIELTGNNKKKQI